MQAAHFLYPFVLVKEALQLWSYTLDFLLFKEVHKITFQSVRQESEGIDEHLD